MLVIMQYRAHLPPRYSNLAGSTFTPLRGHANLSVSYRALAYGTVNTETDTIPSCFVFEYDTSPILKGGENQFLSFVKSVLEKEDFGIQDPQFKIYPLQPIGFYGSGFFLDGIHKTPNYEGLDLFFSTVPPEEEGKPWWGEYYDPAVRHLYNPPPEIAFAEDARSYLYTQNPDDPRVVCPALIPSHLWDRLRFFIRFFDTVYIFRPTEYAKRRYYRFVEEEFPGWMRMLQGLSWLKEVPVPPEAVGLPFSGAGVFLTVSLGENVGVWSWEVGGEGQVGVGDEILPTPSYYPTALQSSTHAAHLSRGRWKYSPNSGYYPPPPNPTWWDISGFSVVKVGNSLLHYLAYFATDQSEDEWWDATLKEGAQVRQFAWFTTGYYDNQGNWIMPHFLTAESPILVWHGTSGDFILMNPATETVDAENKVIVDFRGSEVYEGVYGNLGYKVIHALTSVARISITSFEKIKENAKVYVPPTPQEMAKNLHPWMELVDSFSFPKKSFLQPQKRRLHYKPVDVNYHVRSIKPPATVVTTGGNEVLDGVSFHVATLPTGESSNVNAFSLDPNKNLTSNSFVDNISAELPETDTGDSVRPWIDQHVLPVFEMAISYIKDAIKRRGFIDTVGEATDMTCWQIKTQKGAPRHDLPVTMTSKKELVKLGDYCERVGFFVSSIPAEYEGSIKVFRRLHGFIPVGAYISLSGEEIDLKAFLRQYGSAKEMAKFPVEKSPKAVMWLGAKVSPPELQFIPAYRVLAPPPLGLLWDFGGKNPHIRRRRTVLWGKLVTGAGGDKEFYAFLGRQVRLLSLVQTDLAFFFYHPQQDAYFIERYSQPIILSSPIDAKLTDTTCDLNLFAEGAQLTQPNASADFWVRDRSVQLLHRIFSRIAEMGKLVKDIETDEELNGLFSNLSLAVQGIVGEDVDGRKVLRELLLGNFDFHPAVLGKQVDWLPNLLGWRELGRSIGSDKTPQQIDLRQLSKVSFVLVEPNRKQVTTIVGGQVLERKLLVEDNASIPPDARVVEEIRITNRLVAKAFHTINSHILSQSPYLTLINKVQYDEQRLRSKLYIVGDEKQNGYTAFVVDPTRYATVLCPYLSIAPWIFPPLPKEELHYAYPLSEKDILAITAFSDATLLPTRVLDSPLVTLRTHLPPELFPWYVWSGLVSREVGISAVRGYPIPPHYFANNQPKYYPYSEYRIQPLPLWLLRCFYVPSDTILVSQRRTTRSSKLIYPPQLELTLTNLNESLKEEFVTLPDKVLVRKFKEDDVLPVVLSIPDSSSESGERLKVLFFPDEEDETFYDKLFVGGEGYFIPTYRYDRAKHDIIEIPCDLLGVNKEYQHPPHVSPFAPEEVWIDGVKKVRAEGWDEEKESAFYRLRYEHPFHPRIYLSIYTLAPNLPVVTGVVKDGQLDFAHSEWESFNYFTLLRGTNPLADGEKKLNSRKLIQKFQTLLDENIVSREEKLFVNYWNRVRDPQSGKVIPTWQELWDKHLSLASKAMSGLKDILLNVFELPEGGEWDDDVEKLFALLLVDKFTQTWDYADYAPFCAYYAPADAIPVSSVGAWCKWWLGEPLSVEERVPCALLVLPKPFSQLQLSPLVQAAWGGIEDILVSIINPQIPKEVHSYSDGDIFSFHPLLARQVLRLQGRELLAAAGISENVIDALLPLVTPHPKVFRLAEMLADPWWWGVKDQIGDVIKFYSNLVLGEIFTSAFFPPRYVPSPLEVMESFFTTTQLFSDIAKSQIPLDVDALPYYSIVLGWRFALRGFAGGINRLNPQLAWAVAEDKAQREKLRLDVKFSPNFVAKLGLRKFGLSLHYSDAPIHPAIWVGRVDGKSFFHLITSKDERVIADLKKVLNEITMPGGVLAERKIALPAWGGWIGGYSAPSPPHGVGGFITRQFFTHRLSTATAAASLLYPVYLDYQHMMYALNEIANKSKYVHIHFDLNFNIKGETDETKKISTSITAPVGDTKYNPMFALHFLLSTAHNPDFASTWLKKLLSVLYRTYFPAANVDGVFVRPVRPAFLGGNRGAAIINFDRCVLIPQFPTFATTVSNIVVSVYGDGDPAVVQSSHRNAGLVAELQQRIEKEKSHWLWWWGKGSEGAEMETLWSGVELSVSGWISHAFPLHPFVLAVALPDILPLREALETLLRRGIEKETKIALGSLTQQRSQDTFPLDVASFLPAFAYNLNYYLSVEPLTEDVAFAAIANAMLHPILDRDAFVISMLNSQNKNIANTSFFLLCSLFLASRHGAP